VSDSINECSRKNRGKEVSERVALLKHTRYDSACKRGAIFKC
jgi:hypothetical protein